MEWPQIEQAIGDVLVKMAERAAREAVAAADGGLSVVIMAELENDLTERVRDRVLAVKDIFVMLHALAGHNGCGEKCWHQMIDEAEARWKQEEGVR